jgi:hypothetical protein
VAGPKLTGVELRLATVGAPIKATKRKAKAAAPVQGDVMPVNVIGGRRSQTRSSAAADHLNRPSHQEGAA